MNRLLVFSERYASQPWQCIVKLRGIATAGVICFSLQIKTIQNLNGDSIKILRIESIVKAEGVMSFQSVNQWSIIDDDN